MEMEPEIPIRRINDGEFGDLCALVESAFGEHLTDEDLRAERDVAEVDRCLAALDGDRIVGGAGAYSMELTVPGASVPIAGVTGVGVAPTHRRRGILRSLMRRQLDDVHARGEAIAALWASEGSIYGRFGYGLAAPAASFEIERGRSAFAFSPPADGRVILVEKDEALRLMPGPFSRAFPDIPGMIARPERRWRHEFRDSESHREGASALFFAVHESARGRVQGYVAYRIKGDWNDAGPNGTVIVRELLAETPAAYASLWRYCLDMDLTVRTRAWNRPPDEPLLHMLADPRRLGLRIGDGLWLRLVDVPAALAARRYRVDGALAIGVRDPFCPWNEGVYALEGGPQGATCGPVGTGSAPDLALSANDLGAVYLGGVTFDALARAGRVSEERAGAIGRADEMFRTNRAPWCPVHF